jgi:outer membrane protein assembly factor BamB
MKSHLVLTVVVTVLASGADWLRFRGPDGSGVGEATNLPVEWSSKDNIIWKTELPGPGTSSPITVGKQVFLTCYSGYGLVPDEGDMNQLMRHLVCVDATNGNLLWTKDFKPILPESRYQRGNNSQHGYSSSTPASDGKHLYVFFGKSGVYCLDLNGKEIWHASVGDQVHGWGSANSPVLYKDLVIINASIESGSLIALDKQTGKEVWRVPDIRSAWNTPVLVEAAGGTELVLNESRAVIGFDPATGKELWRVSGFRGYVCPSVVAHKGIVYVVRGEALAIRAGGRGDVSESHVLWRARGNSRVSSPVYHEGRLYWGGSECVDAATGKRSARGRLSKRASFYASPVVADGKIYYVSRFDGTFVLAAGTEFKELAHNTFADDTSRTNASPIVSQGKLLLRTDRFLYCIGKK